jgi:hypothetical protein
MRVSLYVRPALRPLGDRFLVHSWLATTIGHTIVSWRRLDEAELAHEVTHVRQWERFGAWRYPLAYLGSSARAWLGERDWYRDNTFEIDAQAVEADVRAGRRPGPRSGR